MSHSRGERCSSRRTGKGRFGQAAPLLLGTAASRRVAELGLKLRVPHSWPKETDISSEGNATVACKSLQVLTLEGDCAPIAALFPAITFPVARNITFQGLPQGNIDPREVNCVITAPKVDTLEFARALMPILAHCNGTLCTFYIHTSDRMLDLRWSHLFPGTYIFMHLIL